MPFRARRAIVWCQSTVVLSSFTAPQPDLVLLPPHDHRFRERHPRPEDIWLAIEVADTSLAYDRGRKAKLYAEQRHRRVLAAGRAWPRAGDPPPAGADGYGILLRAAPGELIAPDALPDCLLDWARVFA